MDIYQYFQRIVVDGVEYWDSLIPHTHVDALALAKQFNLRILERWELCRLYDESDYFRSSLDNSWYWSATVYDSIRIGTWRFHGASGSVDVDYRHLCYGIRCTTSEVI